MNIKTISELSDIAGKYILLRDDFNVQITDGRVVNIFRIEQSLPTIRALKEMGARIAIVAHLGRPDGKRNPEYSLAPVAFALSELLGEPVPLISDCIGEPVADARQGMQNGDVVLLENVRFHPGEEQNDPEFAAALAAGFDIFVNDAFAAAHRAHASVAGVTKFLPAYAGELLADEIRYLTQAVRNPKRPLVGLISGAKIKSKIGIIKAFGKMCDHVICAGGIGTGMLAAMGAKNLAMDADNLEKYDNNVVLEIMREFGDKIILPLDKGVGPKWAKDAPRTDKMMADILPTDVPMDEGPMSVAEYERVISGAKTLVWNGTVGMAEWPPVWSAGTFALARYIAQRTRSGELESIVGGGDTIASLEATGTEKDVTYASTGGGAFLEFIEGKVLPGIAALSE
ncbi:MAG: phosphoglycerate kinase [Alphaproteobacteria bacterium]|nr:phosphoglycerate kinase [Alphaproteobacteria bacterium]